MFAVEFRVREGRYKTWQHLEPKPCIGDHVIMIGEPTMKASIVLEVTLKKLSPNFKICGEWPLFHGVN